MTEQTVNIGQLSLQNGQSLYDVEQRVTIYGDLKPANGIVLVTHALSGNSRAADWWSGLVGAGRLFDPGQQSVVCINALGSCYGSTGPASAAPDGDFYGSRFPVITVPDIVNAQASALSALGIERVDTVVGGSLGGMQALQWALSFPHRVDAAIVIGAYDHFSARGIALNSVARDAIECNPRDGLALARKIAMISYKSEALLESRHSNRFDRAGGDPSRELSGRFDVEGYLDHQGALFTQRMNKGSYVTLTRAMDLFDVRNAELKCVKPRLTFVGISSDGLFSPGRVREAAQRLKERGFTSTYVELESTHGHDAFLSEGEALSQLLNEAALRPASAL